MGFLDRFRAPPKRRVVPSGTRVYAIGDVHGRDDLLAQLLERIEQDDQARGPTKTMLIFLGDLVDRGPESRAVVERVKALCDAGRARLIKGNHEELLVESARGDREAARAFYRVGGIPTLQSYGIDEEEAGTGSFADLCDLMQARIPAAHVDFLDAAEDAIAIGDYVFVHAGLRPGIPLEAQEPRELRWIRAEFTRSAVDHGSIVIHGHTISEQVEVRPNRIGLDTGAYASGVLTALGLEGEDRWFLATPASGDRRGA